MKDAGTLRPEHVSLGKMGNVRGALEVCRSARTILGGERDHARVPVIRHMNNLESVLTYEGTHEVHTLVVGQALTGDNACRPRLTRGGSAAVTEMRLLRPAGHRRADRGPVGLRARGRRLVRGDRVEPRADPGGPALLPLRDPARCCRCCRRRCAAWRTRTGSSRTASSACPDPDERLVMRIDRIARAGAAHRGPDVPARGRARAPSASTRPRTMRRSPAVPRRPGSTSLTVFNDLWYQPALGPLLHGAGHGARAARACGAQSVHRPPVRDRGPDGLSRRGLGGRAYVGLAKGAWLDRLGLDEERPLRALREAAAVVRALLAGDEGGVDGERFRLEPGTTLAYPRVRDRVPLLIGSWGRRTLAWAGAAADEVKLGGTANPELRTARAGVDRQPGHPARHGLRHGGRRGRRRARARAYEAVRPYVEVVGALDPTLADAGGSLPLDRFCLAGTPEEVAERVRGSGRRGRPCRARDAAGPDDAGRRRAHL